MAVNSGGIPLPPIRGDIHRNPRSRRRDCRNCVSPPWPAPGHSSASSGARADDCLFEPQTSSPEDLAREELSVILCTQDAETLLPYIDLHSYGRALLERDHAVITNYGLLEKRPCEQLQDMAQENSSEGMVMM